MSGSDEIEKLVRLVVEVVGLLRVDDVDGVQVMLAFGRDGRRERYLGTENVDPWHATCRSFAGCGATAEMALLELHAKILERFDDEILFEEERARQAAARMAAMRAAKEAGKR